jgi:predicted RNA-binding protein
MSKQIIDCVFFHENKDILKNRIEKFSSIVDKFFIFYKGEMDLDLFTGTTKPIDLVLVEEELYITEFINYVKSQELDFEDVISISVTNEFYMSDILDDVKKLLTFGPVILEKHVFYTEKDPIEFDTYRGTTFFYFNHIKYDVFDTKKIWLGKQKYDGNDVNFYSGGYHV